MKAELTNRQAITTPLKSKMLVPIILKCRELLLPYSKPYVMTDRYSRKHVTWQRNSCSAPMNNANQVARQKTAVDVLNAVILLLKLEADCFGFYQCQAWEWEDILTDKGMRLMEECFDGVKTTEYQMNTVGVERGHQVTQCQEVHGGHTF